MPGLLEKLFGKSEAKKNWEKHQRQEVRFQAALLLTTEEIEALPIRKVTLKEFCGSIVERVDLVTINRYDHKVKLLPGEMGLTLDCRYVVEKEELNVEVR